MVRILKEQYKRVSDGEIFTPILVDENLGYYKSLMKLKDDGHDVSKLIDFETVKLNPSRFIKIIDNTSKEADIEHFLSVALSGFYLTNDGIVADLRSFYRPNDKPSVQISGSCLITDTKVYRPTQYTYIGENWRSVIEFYKKNKKLVESVCEKIIIDLNDHDCCADGFITFENKDIEDVSTFVRFNRFTHEYLGL